MVTVGLCENRLASAIGELESAKGQVSENLLDPYASGESASEQIHQLQQRQEAILSHISRIEEALSMVRERHNLLIQQISTSTSQETDLHAYEAFAEEHNLNQVQVEAETLLHTLKAIAGVDSETLHSIRIQQLDNTIHEGPTTTQATTTSQHPSGPPQTTHDPSHTVADLQSETVQQLDNLHVETPIQQTVTTIKPVKKSAVASHRPHLSIQLEKLRLPTFDGDATKFQHFWCSFELAVHNDDSIDLNMKYLYLQSLIKGEAKVVLQDLVPGECNYYHLVQTLKKRYDCPRKTRALLHHQLYQLPPSTDAASDMRSTWFRVSGILHSLQRFEDLNKVVSIIDLVRSKFPLVIQEKLNDAEFQRGTDFDLKQAMVHLDNIISSRERFEYTCARSNIFNVNRDQNAHNPQSCSQSLNVNYDPSRCCFCNSPLHNSRRCEQQNPAVIRRKIVSLQGLCWKCFDQGHRQNNCNYPSCRNCGGNHHQLLCTSPRRGQRPFSDHKQLSTSELRSSRTCHWPPENSPRTRSPARDGRRSRDCSRDHSYQSRKSSGHRSLLEATSSSPAGRRTSELPVRESTHSQSSVDSSVHLVVLDSDHKN
ncbi:hypothetical protein Y032_0015g2828 [Ancylostoma ceylanicum]|uniref:CCHC-type domain-containing protein n=1 Tax=Ancylostoma ceylanicum TaxID=53326 RepID=A0A016V8K1_9BILA|nr:hypothetical protein Y032_0015g2828 [Ancylostoma ceylanicum]